MKGMGGVQINESGTMAVVNHKRVLVVTASEKVSPGATPVESTLTNASSFVPWGTSNNYPKETITKIYKNSFIPSIIAHRTNSIYSGGYMYGISRGYKLVGGNWVENFEPIFHPDVEKFKSENDIDAYVHEALRDLLTWNHALADISLNKSNRVYAGSICCQDFMFFRFKPADEKTGRISKGVLSGKFGSSYATSGNSQDETELDLVDTYYRPLENVRKGKATRFLYPMTIFSHGKTYYQDASWQSILATKWLSVAEKISEFKDFLLDNQMTLKYVIHIPEEYWIWRFKGWNEATQAKRDEFRTIVMEEINSNLTGVEKVGKTLGLTFKSGYDKGQSTKWEIQEMTGINKLDGALIEDSHEASTHIYAAFGFHPSLMGNSPGQQRDGGSGSDIRVAHNVDSINTKVYMDKVLNPLNFISQYNNWNKDGFPIKWISKSSLITTLNTGTEIGTTTDANAANVARK